MCNRDLDPDVNTNVTHVIEDIGNLLCSNCGQQITVVAVITDYRCILLQYQGDIII